MFIFVGVTINATINDGGLFSQAGKAAKNTTNSVIYESNVLPNEMGNFVNEQLKDIFQ